MALSNYSNLKLSIADYLNRDDLDAAIPDFISLAEAKLRRRYKDFAALSNQNSSNWILSNYPDVYLYGALLEAAPYLMEDARVGVWGELYAIAVKTLKGTVDNAELDTYNGLKLAIGDWIGRADIDSAIPQLIKLAEAKLFRKFDGIAALSSANQSNSLLLNNPDLYLYGALSHAAPYIGDDPRIPVWASLYESEIAKVKIPRSDASLSTYAGLQATISEWLERYDLDPIIPQLIKLAEVKLLRKFDGVTALSNQNTTNWILENHPDLYLYASLTEAQPYLNNDERIATWRTLYEAEALITRKPSDSANLDDYTGLKATIADWLERYDIDDTVDIFIGLVEARLSRQFRDVTALSPTNLTNWVLLSHPDVYLYGSLAESAPYVGEDARTPLWQAKYESALQEIRRPDSDSSLDTYAGLKFAISDWLDRPDLDSIIPKFIQLAEAQISRNLRHWRQQSRVTTTLNEGFEFLPNDFLEAVHFYIDTGEGEKTLEFASQAEISRRKLNSAGVTGEPAVYTINSGQIEFVPAPDDDYPLTLIYYATIGSLSGEVDTNWLLTRFPDVYLYASLLQSAPYLKDDQRVAVWGELYAQAIAQANKESESAMYSGPLVMRNK